MGPAITQPKDTCHVERPSLIDHSSSCTQKPVSGAALSSPLTRALVELVEEVVLLLESLHQPVPHTLLPIAPVHVLERQTPATHTQTLAMTHRHTMIAQRSPKLVCAALP